MYRLYSTAIMPLISALMGVIFVVSAAEAASPGDEDPYEKMVLEQIKKISPTTEQIEPFRQVFRDYYGERNGSTRRVARSGGDLAIRVRRDLNRVGRNSVEDMSVVLDPEQLKLYEELVRIGNEQYLANSGLLER